MERCFVPSPAHDTPNRRICQLVVWDDMDWNCVGVHLCIVAYQGRMGRRRVRGRRTVCFYREETRTI